MSDMPSACVDRVWQLFHAALEPVYRAGHLGAVVFQFHLGFAPGAANLEYLLSCRRRLDPRFAMAAELRCRAWLTDSAWRSRLCAALAAHGIALVSADELAHESAQKDREQRGLPPGATREVLPIATEVTVPDFLYVRVHRRHGTLDRLLQPEEVAGWAARLRALAPALRGPIYFLALDAALGPALAFDWRRHTRQALLRQPGSIGAFFPAGGAGKHTPREGEGEAEQQQAGEPSRAAAQAQLQGQRGQQPRERPGQHIAVGSRPPEKKKRRGIAAYFTAAAPDATPASSEQQDPQQQRRRRQEQQQEQQQQEQRQQQEQEQEQRQHPVQP
eukprot:scaffold14.g1203.t1